MSATANDLINSGKAIVSVHIDGIDKPVDIECMTVDQAIKFSELAKSSKDYTLMYASLVKLCCPAFRGWWWTRRRIKKQLSLKVLLALAEKIMEVSGLTTDAVDAAVKE